MKRNICFFMMITLIIISLSANQIRVRVTQYPPQYYKDSSDNWTGIDIELAEAIIRNAGFTPDFIELPWSRALKDIEEGNIDMMMNLSKTDERSLFLNWIGPERHSRMVIILNKENRSLKINTLEDLIVQANKQKLNFGIQADAFYSEEFNKKLTNPEFSKFFDAVPKSETNYVKLEHKRILGLFDEALSATDKIKKNENYKNFIVHSFIISSEPVFFGISKKLDPEKFNKLQKSFQQLEKSGTLKKIRDKYYKL